MDEPKSEVKKISVNQIETADEPKKPEVEVSSIPAIEDTSEVASETTETPESATEPETTEAADPEAEPGSVVKPTDSAETPDSTESSENTKTSENAEPAKIHESVEVKSEPTKVESTPEAAGESKPEAETSETSEPEAATAAEPPADQIVPQLIETDSDKPAKPIVMKVFNWRKLFRFGLALLFLGLVAIAWLHFGVQDKPKSVVIVKSKTQTITKSAANATTNAQGLQLYSSKNYGNKYANGVLPVGDGKYSTTSAKAGTVFVCSQYAKNLSTDSGGAQTRGPWFTNNNTEYDLNKKAEVRGAVSWQSSFSNTVSGSTRTISTNDLPNHVTGAFPIASSDPAYAYDRNPNSIKTQTLSYGLPANPIYNAKPNCMGGEAGVMLTGVALFNTFDAGGRDAGAWEVQDSCSGHPQVSGEYHYHSLSACIKDIGIKTVIGYALDGFPITGPQIAANNILTTSDLDECHGITSDITVSGKTVTSYHYVMTQDFPYSTSCFRGTAINPPSQQTQTPAHP